MTDTEKVKKTIQFGVEYGGFDEVHHKNWCIDQMIRILAGDKYEQIVEEACDGKDGPATYYWDCGIAP